MTTAELVPAENLAALETLDSASREVAVTGMLAEARSWLAHALAATGPSEIVDFKAKVAGIVEMTKQLHLSEEIQTDALEMLRRAERGVGVAVRQEQQPGGSLSATRGGDRKSEDRIKPDDNRFDPAPTLKSLVGRESLNGSSSQAGIADLTDNVSDEEFEQALGEARDEGNLSRMNVARKLGKKATAPASGRPDHLRGTRHIDPVRVIANTVSSLEGTRIVLDLLEEHHYAQLDPEMAAAWADSLKKSIASLNALNKKLKELTQA
jgi:hypothetical protein